MRGMRKVTVLGAGMVGRAMAIDLCMEYRILAVDRDPEALSSLEKDHPIDTACMDLQDPAAVREASEGAELVIGAVPGFLGYRTLETLIAEGKNVVDISFFPEDPFLLDEAARKRNLTVIVDCGVAPGMCNALLGHHHGRMEVEQYECLVGGLPLRRLWPYQYKAPFSPIDVIEEYIRPARLVENGEIVTRPALSDPELVEIDPIGTLEAFNTDGLRTLIRTVKVPFMKERTLRYPGHIEYMRVFRESGFFGKEPIEINGALVRPIDVTAALLFPKWKLSSDEYELTVMRVRISGKEQGARKEYQYSLFDQYDEKTRTSSMARTTGYTCTAAARLVLEGRFARKGICPPEYLGMDEQAFSGLLELLKARNIHYTKTERSS